MSIDYLLDWRFFNILIPFVGILIMAYTLFSGKICTQGKTVSTSVVLCIFYWLMLMWADWGSTVFTPSRQTMAARVIILIVTILIMSELRRATYKRNAMQAKNRRLLKCVKNLKAQIEKNI